MTAEIALLNTQAVALAADSAVTIQHETKLKVRPTANKIFLLSKYSPIAVMIYDQAELVGVPWETLVKACREDLGSKSLSTVQEYANHLFRFIGESGIVPPGFEQRYFLTSLGSYLSMLTKELIRVMRDHENRGRKITKSVANRQLATIIRRHYECWSKAEYLDPDGPSRLRRIRREFADEIRGAIQSAFGNLPLSSRSRDCLLRIACNLPLKWPSDLRPPKSGVVVAGFGKESTFPSLRAFEVSGVLHARLKLVQDDRSKVDIGVDTGAAIVPFAQRQWVDAFLYGLHPLYEVVLQELVADLVKGVSIATIDRVRNLTPNQKKREKERVTTEAISDIVKDKLQELNHYTFQEFIQPVVSTLASLQKEELASVAESLVGLTSFRQQVTMEAETVGGPVDVAIISKGDGFIWIKRKHYFEPKLNPHFFATYYATKEADDA